MRLTLASLAILAALAGGARAADRALVIGVDHYPGITVGGLAGQKDLGGAVFDARTFKSLLEGPFGVAPDDIHLLLDGEATRQHILDEIGAWLIDGSKAGDRVFLYFAGHGAAVRVTDEATGAGRLTSAIVPADAAGDLTESPLAIKNLILGVDIHHLLDRLADRQVTVVADSCQSGSVSRDALHPLVIPPNVHVRTLTPAGAIGMTERAFMEATPLRRDAKLSGRLLEIEPDTAPASAKAAATAGTLAVWSAATTDQVTFDRPDGPGGVFTQNFAAGLRDKKAADPSGAVTAGALLTFVRDQAKSFCSEAGPACSAGLTPQLIAGPDYLVAPLFAAAAPASEHADAPAGSVLAGQLDALLQHHNDFALDVTMLPATRVRLGQALQFRVTSAEAGQVAVFDLTPDGDLTQIFPNAKTERAGRVRAGAPLTMPDAYWGISFKATPPTGPGALLVLVTEPGLDLSAATGLNLGFKPVGAGSRLLQVVADTVAKPVISPTLDVPTRAPHWAFVRLPYEVVP